MDQNFKSWIDAAGPDDLTVIGKQVLTRIGTLSQEHRNRFYNDLKSDPNVARLFEKTTA